MLPMNMPHRKNLRREEGNERDAETAKLSPQQRLERLDRRLGEGVGAVKERARLTQLMASASQKKAAEKQVEESKEKAAEAKKPKKTPKKKD